MTINRSLWLQPFSKASFPDWSCPICTKGILRPVNGSSHSGMNADSKLAMKSGDWDEETTVFRYSVMLECNNEKCKENVASVGYGKIDDDSLYDHDMPLSEEYFPKYFLPHLKIFPISSKCPDHVAREIKRSFKLFFAESPAAANYVCKAVDAILTDKGLKRYSTNKGRTRINLHDRIISFQKKQSILAEKLFAIKWLGNEGSHTNKMTKNDVLDAYEILEVVIDELYIGYRILVDKKVAKINKGKNPLHPST